MQIVPRRRRRRRRPGHAPLRCCSPESIVIQSIEEIGARGRRLWSRAEVSFLLFSPTEKRKYKRNGIRSDNHGTIPRLTPRCRFPLFHTVVSFYSIEQKTKGNTYSYVRGLPNLYVQSRFSFVRIFSIIRFITIFSSGRP